MKKVAVIGSGLGGLSAALYLASLNYEVTIYEKNSYLGGKVGEFKSSGYRFDTGPSVITMPFVFKDLFEFAGENIYEHLKFLPVEPSSRNYYAPGKYVDLFNEVELTASELAKVSPEDAKNYRKYLEYGKKIYDNSADVFLFEPLSELKYLLKNNKIPPLTNLRNIDLLNTVHSGNKKFFKNENILKIFDRFATYNGSNPYIAPATLNIIPYVELGLGSFYIKEGIYRLVEAVHNLLKYKKVEIYTNTLVEKVVQINNKIVGLQVNNQVINYDYIVCNSDVVESFSTLIDGFDKKRSSLQKLEPSLSGMVFMWGVNKKHDKLKHHNVIFSNDYEREFKQIFDEKTAPDDPTIYIAITSKSDSNHSPEQSENWFVLLNMPYITDNQNWEDLTKTTRKVVLDKLKKYGLDIEKNIEVEKILNPLDLYDLYGSNKGSIYGISSNKRSTAFKRPANRSREIEGLFFVGGATHPGGGLPLVTLSGKNAAMIINNFEGF